MYNVGDKIKSKKPHACGGNVWTVVRTGSDYKLKCDKCSHEIWADSTALKKMIKEIIFLNEDGQRN